MATDFLIALATALGSATVLLLALRLALKAFAPRAFKELIPLSARPLELRSSGTVNIPVVVPTGQVIIDGNIVSALSETQMAGLLSYKAHTVTISNAVATSSSGSVDKDTDDRHKAPSFEEAMSPRGQVTSHFGTTAEKKPKSGVPNEALCGSAS